MLLHRERDPLEYISRGLLTNYVPWWVKDCSIRNLVESHNKPSFSGVPCEASYSGLQCASGSKGTRVILFPFRVMSFGGRWGCAAAAVSSIPSAGQ